MTTPSTPAPTLEQLHPLEAQRREQVAAFPYVALNVSATGIHPSTGRLVAIDAQCFNAAGEFGPDYYAVFNPETLPGPRHEHGMDAAELAEGVSFSKALKQLDRLLDGRILVVHGTPMVWGFIVAEARKAMTAAARANRSRNRNRGRRRRQKVGHVPLPESIVDTLATARYQGHFGNDERLAAIAADSGLTAPDPTASSERARRKSAEVMRESTQLLVQLYLHQAAVHAETNTPLSTYTPEELRADRFGLQRSHVRVDAAEAPRLHDNPGFLDLSVGIKPGMEFTVSPEVTANPDELIAAGMRAELNYVEKLSRETSFVVCNKREDLVGKAMHAHRKHIPLLADADFLDLVRPLAVSPASSEAEAGDTPAADGHGEAQEASASGARGSGAANNNDGEAPRKPKRRRGSRGGHNRRRRNSSKPAQPNADS